MSRSSQHAPGAAAARAAVLTPAHATGRLPISGGGERRHGLFGAVGGNHRVPALAGGDDGVQLPQDRSGDHGLGSGPHS